MQDTIETIFEEIRKDPDSRIYEEAGQIPLFSAPAGSRILIVGQAPEAKAMAKRMYWDDQSGDRLRNFMGIDRTEFYDSGKLAIVPMDFYFTGKGKSGDLPPRSGFAEKWHGRILALCPDIRMTILIGQYAQAYYLGDERKKTLTDTVHCFREYLPKYFPIVHPSPRNQIWMKKNPWFEKDVLPVLKQEVRKALYE